MVAGSFYPDSKQVLETEVNAMLAKVSSQDITPKALIVPHAGYCYSGEVAAYAYKLLQKHPENYHRVVLLGPSHRVPLQGCAVTSHDTYSTPLGKIPVDTEYCAQLVEQGLAIESDQAHMWEHSLEVQLPFLQACLPQFNLVPVVVGDCPSGTVAKLLNQVAMLPGTLTVISTDLSHFHNYNQARSLDTKTVGEILDYMPILEPTDACGCHAVNGFLTFCQQHNWQINLLKLANSGDYQGDKNGVVGYASFAIS